MEGRFQGERFSPMDDELIRFYLMPMLSGETVPGRNCVVFDCDLYGKHEPWQIWDEFKTRRAHDVRQNKDLYFFTQQKHRSSTDKRIRRNVGTGSWHGDDRGKPITCEDTGARVGFKKRLTYKNQDSVHDGCWILYEFCPDPSLMDKLNDIVNKDYVLCLLRKNDEPKNNVTKLSKKRKKHEENGDVSKKQRSASSTDVVPLHNNDGASCTGVVPLQNNDDASCTDVVLLQNNDDASCTDVVPLQNNDDASAPKHLIFGLVPEEQLVLNEYGGLTLEEMELALPS